MGVQNIQYSDDIVGYAVIEADFGVAVVPAATDAFRATEITITPAVNRQVHADHQGTRDQMGSFEGRRFYNFTASCYFRPSESLGVAPECGELLQVGFGAEAVIASTSVTYTLLKDASGIHMTLYRMETDDQMVAYSAIVTSIALSGGGDQPTMIVFTGVAAGGGRTSQTLTVGVGAPDTALIVADADFLAKYGVVQVDGDVTAHQITAIAHATETATIDPQATWGNSDIVKPWLPGPTFGGGDPIYGSDGEFSLDGGSSPIKILTWSLTINTGNSLVNDEYGYDIATDVQLEQRSVDVSVNFIAKRERSNLDSLFWRKQSQDLNITIGDTAAARMTIDCPVFEPDPGEYSSPDTGRIEYAVSGRCFGTSGEDSVALVLD